MRQPVMSSLANRSMMQKIQTLFSRTRLPFGIDAFSFMNACVFLFALVTSIRSATLSVYRYIAKTFLVSVIISEQDPFYEEILRWMHDFEFARKEFLSMKVVSFQDQISGTMLASNDDFSGMTPAVPMQPFRGTRAFKFQGRWMLFKHTSPSLEDGYRGNRTGKKSYVEIQCMSTTLKPIRSLLEDARLHSRKVSLTSVWRAIYLGRDMMHWRKVASRPVRDISTVIIDKEKKQALLDDIEEYLQPRTRRWYANHGVPYRRGFLFSGPPGTGKTSLASAIAGFFALDIYVLSLHDPLLNESTFQKLLSEVPTRCIVLLEDIDTAEMTQKPDSASGDNAQPRGERKSNGPPTSVSLSCLLNAVDGVSSPEGRILIMSTNYPENINKALTRPGRVDLHMRFELPSEEQLFELFLSIYSEMADEGSQALSNSRLSKKNEIKSGIFQSTYDTSSTNLQELARRFATSLPANKFSAADIQGFLLKYKGQPKAACEHVAEWLEQDGRNKR